MKKLFCAVVATALLLASAPSNLMAATDNAGLNKAFWPLNDRFTAALNSGDQPEIAASGQAIIDLFLEGADPSVKAAQWQAGGDIELDIMRGVTESVAEAYEAMGDQERAKAAFELALPLAVAWQEVNAPVDTEFVRTIMQNKIDAFDVAASVYAEIPGNGGAVSYHNAKFEPATGIYYGEVHSENPSELIQSGKAPSAGLFYVQYENESMESFDWMIRPLSQTRDILEIAWNLAYEGSTLPNVPNDRAKIESSADYLASLGIPILLRFGAEMNVWENKADPEQFKTAFRFVSQIMKERAPNVAMLWSPGVVGHIETTYDMFYPGDEYVDWVGVSLYTLKYFQGNKYLDETSQAMYLTDQFANPVKQMEEFVSLYGGRKPIALSECGVENYSVSNQEDVSDWAKIQLRAIYQTIPMIYPSVKAMLYFNTDPPNIYEAYSFTLYDNYEMAALYTELVSNPYFIARGQTQGAVTYKKLEAGTAMPANSVTLLTYAPYVKKPNMAVTYWVDGTWMGVSDTAAYKSSFDLSAFADGAHTLSVTAASDGVELSRSDFNIYKNGSTITIQ